MDRRDPNLWAGAFGTLICLAVGAVLLTVQLQGGQISVLPGGIWWACYVGYLVALVVSSWFQHEVRRRVALAAFGAQVAFGIVLVASAPGAGWTPILLVYTAAASAYLVRWRTTAAVVVANSATVAFTAWAATGQVLDAVLGGGLYTLLQLGSYFAVRAQLREVEMRSALAVAHTELRATSTLLASATRADERLRIARELHDAVGHQLTVLALELEIASHRSAPPAAEHVVRARGIARDLLADVRQVVGELRERAPDLRRTLASLVADLPAPRVHLDVADDVEADEIRTIALVRCVQEVVTNAIRHSGAEHLWIEVRLGDDGALVLEASDDGRGAERIVVGNGLRGLAERVADLGGEATFSARGGFHVRARVPAS
ncbi:histidine kinase [Beutenbergia cavernae DSM 12333]|uniref:Histidine kinase n=1 Tax=Beutenbergia cavernae (strain ATCC BAA-8 / DSM 12333 / CCUG 43141 / JCM 11478 / NBRC 16432 / NCIMB 13614 / HKI 0122) TaxID=471853 RepID=C5C4C1_BEUC1|nr:histidine kinase [Beutenbergia cavernae]ACQ82045.1 histidine kinase [Beutenbergia cavernae DSM 12333]